MALDLVDHHPRELPVRPVTPIVVHFMTVQSKRKRIRGGERQWYSNVIEIAVTFSGGKLGKRKRTRVLKSISIADPGGIISHGTNVQGMLEYLERRPKKKRPTSAGRVK